MGILQAVPGWLAAIVWLLVAVVAVILVAMVVHALGGFTWNLVLGHFRLLVQVT